MPLVAAQVKTILKYTSKMKKNTIERLNAFSVQKFTLDDRKFHTLTVLSAKYRTNYEYC